MKNIKSFSNFINSDLMNHRIDKLLELSNDGYKYINVLECKYKFDRYHLCKDELFERVKSDIQTHNREETLNKII